jgi:hypothetical protein
MMQEWRFKRRPGCAFVAESVTFLQQMLDMGESSDGSKKKAGIDGMRST